jgi:hypothetical protein
MSRPEGRSLAPNPEAKLPEAHVICGGVDDVASMSVIENWIDEAETRVWFLFECGRRRELHGCMQTWRIRHERSVAVTAPFFDCPRITDAICDRPCSLFVERPTPCARTYANQSVEDSREVALIAEAARQGHIR